MGRLRYPLYASALVLLFSGIASATLTRVGSSVTVLPGGARATDVAADTAHNVYLVAGAGPDLNGVFVSEDGAVLGSAFAIAQTPGTRSGPRVAFGTYYERFLVVWVDTRSGFPAVWGRLLSYSASGPVFNSPEFLIDRNGAFANGQIGVAAGYSDYLVVWQQAQFDGAVNDIHAQRRIVRRRLGRAGGGLRTTLRCKRHLPQRSLSDRAGHGLGGMARVGAIANGRHSPGGVSARDVRGDGGARAIVLAKVWNMSSFRVAEEVNYTDMDGTRISESAGWSVVGTGDWSQDLRLRVTLATPGGPDLLWQHDGGWLRIWRVDRDVATKVRTTVCLNPDHVDSTWRVEATAHTNDDGWPDLILRQQTTGFLSIARMNYTNVASTVTPDPPQLRDTNWKIAGAADFNHDLHPDLLWQHQTQGWLMLMLMNGSTMIDSVYLDPARISDSNWKIKTVVDLNNDSWPDLVWQHATTNLSQVWFMRGTTLVNSEYLSVGGSPYIPAGWEIVGPK